MTTVRTALLAGILVFGGVAAPAAAWDPFVEQNPIRKLGRGIANVVSSTLEIPLGMVTVNRVDGPIAGATSGTLLGVAAGLLRAGVGAFEIVTFPAPLPGLGYDPIVEPEFLGQPDDLNNLSLTLTNE
jgi:putative exosortase-associated protein (TIGR04073 family)